MQEVMAAKAWSKLPSEMGVCRPDQDMALMMALEEVLATMQAFTYEEAERDRKRNNK